MDTAQPEELGQLSNRIASANLPSDLKEQLTSQLRRLTRSISNSGYRMEYDREIAYLDFVSSLPYQKSSQDIWDLHRAAAILDQRHYGLKTAKERILEYLAVSALNFQKGGQGKAPVLSFIGLVGSGKTSLAYSIAESLGRQLIRIPLGGLGSVKELRGQSRLSVETEPGRVLKEIHRLQVNNPVILLDEIDRVAEESRAEVMGVLVELLDPEQNWSFVDHYVDYPFDLSKAVFVTTANNTSNIATAVLDRLEIIEMPAYSDEEKIIIGKDYLLPKVLTNAGLTEGVIKIDDSLWPQIVRPLGFDAGIRSLQRTIDGLARKVAKLVVEGQSGPFIISEANINKYLS